MGSKDYIEGGDVARDPELVKKIQGDTDKTCVGLGTKAIKDCLQKCKLACGEDATKPLYAWVKATMGWSLTGMLGEVWPSVECEIFPQLRWKKVAGWKS